MPKKFENKSYWYLVLGLGIVILVITLFANPFMKKNSLEGEIRYVALGDSYTIGEGVMPDESFPEILTKHLQQNGIKITLIANPSRSGYTTADVISEELPVFKSSSPTFATLLIGANDVAQQVDQETFTRQFELILDQITGILPSKERLIILTIPDFSVTPVGMEYGKGLSLSANIQAFNEVIKKEAQERDIAVIDITPKTRMMKEGSLFVAEDGLHPSAIEYGLWEKEIYKKAIEVLKK